MSHVACEYKLRSVVRSSMHPRNWIKRAVVYYAQAAHTFSAEAKSRRHRRKDGSHPTKTRNSTKRTFPICERCHCKTGCLTKHSSCRNMGTDARHDVDLTRVSVKTWKKGSSVMA